jgi:hypothetical protein
VAHQVGFVLVHVVDTCCCQALGEDLGPLKECVILLQALGLRHVCRSKEWVGGSRGGEANVETAYGKSTVGVAQVL